MESLGPRHSGLAPRIAENHPLIRQMSLVGSSAESVGKKFDMTSLQRVGFFAFLKKQADMLERS
ncbi:MAG TPA: hypothetical protein VM260_05695, partial [Pirellula sp.]|nr:hypothetical protein [Pirellula sp.]